MSSGYWGVIFSCRGGSVRCLHFALRDYYAVKCCTASAQNGVKIAAASDVTAGIDCHPFPKVSNTPAVAPELVGASRRRAETLETPKIDFGRKSHCILVEISGNSSSIVNRQKCVRNAMYRQI